MGPVRAPDRTLVNSLDGDLELEYVTFDPGIHFQAKVIQALSICKSGYSALCGDDDFIAPQCSNVALDFLSRMLNPPGESRGL